MRNQLVPDAEFKDAQRSLTASFALSLERPSEGVVSIAGHESFYKVPGFRVLLDFGRAPDDTVKAYLTERVFKQTYPDSYYRPVGDQLAVLPTSTAKSFYTHHAAFTLGVSYLFAR